MEARDRIEEQLILLIEDLTEEIYKYDGFFKFKDLFKPDTDPNVKAMLSEYRYLCELKMSLQDQLLRLSGIL